MASPTRQPSGSTARLWRAVEHLSSDDLTQLWNYAAWRLKALGPRATGLTPGDLLHEAMLRLAEGVRTLPEELSLKNALVGVMRSVAYAWGQRVHQDALAPIQRSGFDTHSGKSVDGVVSITPERIYSAQERLNSIHEAFQNDPEGMIIIRGWEFGMSGSEIQRSMGVSEKRFLAAEKRVYRVLSKLEGPYA